MPETDASFNCILKVAEMIPELKRTIPFSVESTEAGLGLARDFLGVKSTIITNASVGLVFIFHQYSVIIGIGLLFGWQRTQSHSRINCKYGLTVTRQ